MKIILSPAKSLNFEKEKPTTTFSEPKFLSESITIQNTLKKVNPKELSRLMDISDKLSNLNWQRNQDWHTPFTPENARQAIFTFDGDAYLGLNAYSLTDDKLQILQNRLRILSGLYGLLKPLDLIQPYRLEMGTSIAIGTSKNLYEFWKNKITKELNNELNDSDLFINLASTEYFSAINYKELKVPVITPEFRDYKDGKLKMISFFAKKARGLMVRYIIETNAQDVEDLKGFNYEGYAFDSTISKGTKLVFTR